ncbi:MAG: 1-acyl-sn-glycerol-3-phosphate acyltransferase [Clostridiales bacterium]|nr:1-acyl-sn-glycerol-3-phosphate acyltransferase [Clostridiales bacterium]
MSKAYRRHVRFYAIMRRLLGPFFRRLLRYQSAPVTVPEGPYIAVANHTTDLDSILLGISFPSHMYFVASEHIFRNAPLRRLLVWLLDPIPKRKGGADVSTAMQMARRLRKGMNVALFAEGNKSFHGATCPVHPATGSMVRACGASLVTYRFEGGYFTSPRWAHTLRRGRMRGYPVGVYGPAELAALSDQQINRLIARDIDEDAYRTQAADPVDFRGKRLAEGIQNALYLCPRCRAYGTLTARGDRLACGCGLSATYTARGMLSGADVPFETLTAWGAWQREALWQRMGDAGEEAFLSDAGQTVLLIHPDHRTETAAQGTLCMSRRGLRCGDFFVPAEELQGLEIYGRNTLVFSDGKGSRYQVRSATERSGLAYYDAYELMRKERG